MFVDTEGKDMKKGFASADRIGNLVSTTRHREEQQILRKGSFEGILTSRRKSSDSDIICGRYSEHGPLDPHIAKLRKTTKIWKEFSHDFSKKKPKKQNRNDSSSSSSDHHQHQKQQQQQPPIPPFSNPQLKVNCNSQMIMESRDHDNPVALCLEPVEWSNKSSITAANAKFNILASPKLACHRRLKKRIKKIKKAPPHPKPQQQTSSKPRQPRIATSTTKTSHQKYDTFEKPLPIKPSFPVNSTFATAKFPPGRYQPGRGDAMTKRIPPPNSQSGGKKGNSIPLAHFVHNSPKRTKVDKKHDSTGTSTAKASSPKRSLHDQRHKHKHQPHKKQKQYKQPKPSLTDTTETMDAALVLSSLLCQNK